MRDSNSGPEFLSGPLYFVAFLLILVPLLDFAPNVWPPRPAEVGWRYGTVGLFSNYMMTPLLGFVVVLLTAAWAGHALALRVMGWTLIVAAAALLGSTLLFTLDAVQVRATVEAQGQPLVVIGSTRAVIKNLLVVGATLWLGIGALKVARRRTRSPRSESKSLEGGLLK
jgi:hypothetical protein